MQTFAIFCLLESNMTSRVHLYISIFRHQRIAWWSCFSSSKTIYFYVTALFFIYTITNQLTIYTLGYPQQPAGGYPQPLHAPGGYGAPPAGYPPPPVYSGKSSSLEVCWIFFFNRQKILYIETSFWSPIARRFFMTFLHFPTRTCFFLTRILLFSSV